MTTQYRQPMKAEDADLTKLRYPLIRMPKIDGVRAYHPGKFLARSMEPHENRFTANFFNLPELEGLDGELVAEDICHPRLCSLTSSVCSTQAGEPYMLWWLFDDFSVPDLPFAQRYADLQGRVESLQKNHPDNPVYRRLRVVPIEWIHNEEELLAAHDRDVKRGLEGSILRDPHSLHKAGRSTNTKQECLRMKAFADAECIVFRLEEGQTNGNEQTRGANGRAKRSSHKANMTPNGMIGAYIGHLVRDVVVNNGAKVLPAGMEVRVSAGKMTHDERKHLFENPHLILGRMTKFQHLATGVKDTVRMATHHSFRSTTDM